MDGSGEAENGSDPPGRLVWEMDGVYIKKTSTPLQSALFTPN